MNDQTAQKNPADQNQSQTQSQAQNQNQQIQQGNSQPKNVTTPGGNPGQPKAGSGGGAGTDFSYPSAGSPNMGQNSSPPNTGSADSTKPNPATGGSSNPAAQTPKNPRSSLPAKPSPPAQPSQTSQPQSPKPSSSGAGASPSPKASGSNDGQNRDSSDASSDESSISDLAKKLSSWKKDFLGGDENKKDDQKSNSKDAPQDKSKNEKKADNSGDAKKQSDQEKKPQPDAKGGTSSPSSTNPQTTPPTMPSSDKSLPVQTVKPVQSDSPDSGGSTNKVAPTIVKPNTDSNSVPTAVQSSTPAPSSAAGPDSKKPGPAGPQSEPQSQPQSSGPQSQSGSSTLPSKTQVPQKPAPQSPAQPDASAKPQPMPVSKSQLNSSQKSQPQPQSKPQSKPQPQSQPQTQPAADAKKTTAKPGKFPHKIDQLLQMVIDKKASDLHITAGYPAMLRVDGALEKIDDNLITEEISKDLILPVLPENKQELLEVNREVDLAYSYEEKARFRINAYYERGRMAAAFRLIPNKIRTIEELKLPTSYHQIAKLPQGFVLVTGPTGHGKSTTLAAILNEINLNQPKHIITIEDPIEYVYPPGTALVDQREMHEDTHSWEIALRSAMRQDPDVVLVGEMRDYETIAAAITLAETGHLVLATLHTNNASQTIDRIIDVFPEHQQEQIRTQLANIIEAVISQRLIPITGGGRRAVSEIMFATSAVKNLIREGKTYQIDNVIRTSMDVGMKSLEQSLVDLVREGVITTEDAENAAVYPEEITRLLK